MALFSQSFNLGDDTLNNIEKQLFNQNNYEFEKPALPGPSNRKQENKIEQPPSTLNNSDIIEDSPTNQTQVSIRKRLRSSRLSQKKLKIDPPAPYVENSLLNDNCSDFFKIESQTNNIKAVSYDNNLSNFFDSEIVFNASKIEHQSTQIRSDIVQEKIDNLPDRINLSEVEEMFMDSNIDLNDNIATPQVESGKNEIPDIHWNSSIQFNIEEVSKTSIAIPVNENIETEVLDPENITFTVNLREGSAANVSLNKSELRTCKKNIKQFLNNEDRNNSFNGSFRELNNSNSILRIHSLSQTVVPKKNVETVDKIQDSVNIDEPLKNVNANKDSCLLLSWGLPESILTEYKNKGIEKMFDWQTECLSKPRVLFELSNLVYSAPTSSGKTLVSEILMIKTVLERRKKSIIILPFISVVREKMFYLQDILTPSNIRVDGFFGGYHPPGGFEKINIAVCTIEKANSIINRLLEKNRLDDIGAIVLDEIHLISDPNRGYILELLISKIIFACKKNNLKIQIITMSATLPNTELLTNWLNAEYYSTNFRPVNLNEMIKIGTSIYDEKGKLIRTLNNLLFSEISGSITDQDDIAQLCIETILEECSVIVFCPSKDWCESLALGIAEIIYKIGKFGKNNNSKKLRERIDMKLIDEMKNQFQNSPTGMDESLAKCLSYGCAFHHAGLTTDERDLIESNFKNGILKVIIATSTLSSGVNLPARRVIIRTPLFAGKMMNSLTYRQMIGRAGRTGKDIIGESILVCNDSNAKVGKELVFAKLTEISSCLDVNDSHLKRAILEIIASGFAKTIKDLELFIQCTLLHTEKPDYFYHSIDESKNTEKSHISKTIQFLIEYEFIRLLIDDETNEEIYIPTMLGNACLASSLPPSDGILLFSELQKARQNFVFESELHAVYLVTPYTVCYQLQNLDWLLYLDIWEKLPTSMKRVGELIGLRESFLVKAMRGNSKLDYKLLQIHKRFYTSLALYELINEISISIVSVKYKFSRGLLQSLQQMASTFAGIVQSFCYSLNWQMLGLIVDQFKNRLYFGINQDLIDLMRIPNLSSIRARALYNNGIINLIELANSDKITIENILYNSISFESEKRRDNECDFELNQRNKIRNIYVTGKSNLTVRDAAKLLISDARRFLETEMGAVNINWSKTESIEPSEQPHNSTEIELNQSHKLQPSTPILTNIELNESKISSNENIINQHTNNNNDEPDLFTDNSNNDIQLNYSTDTDQKNLNPETSTSVILNSSYEEEPVTCQSSRFLRSRLRRKSLSHNTILVPQEQDDNPKLPNIIEVFCNNLIFQNFITELNKAKEIGLSLGIEKFEKSKKIIGEHLLSSNKENITENDNKKKYNFNENLFISGITINCNENIYFLNFQSNENEEEIFFLKDLLNRDIFMIMFDAKEQLQMMVKIIPEIRLDEIKCKILDPKVGHWLLKTNLNDEENNLYITFEKMVELYNSENLEYLKLCKTVSVYCGTGYDYMSSVSGKIRSSIECYLIIKMMKCQHEKLVSFGMSLWKYFVDLEMPIQVVLSQMEFLGCPIDSNSAQDLYKHLTEVLKKVENEIYKICGRKFNVNSSNEVAKVLGIPKKPNERATVPKEKLEQIDTPLSNLIIQYRKIAATLGKTMLPILSNIKHNRIHVKNICFTSTGRITMQEPNLQNIAKDFTILISQSNPLFISCRSIFKTDSKSNRCLISADFRQLELRILTHLSKDSGLLRIMKSNEDVFKIIAAKWNSVLIGEVDDNMRCNTKHICYAIIYGMGVKSLSHVLKKDENSVTQILDQFHNTYPGLRLYTDSVIKKSRETGYIETLGGRRRYLPNIKSEDTPLRGQAERQAVNTTIQGSAADITKTAILRMKRNLKKYQDNLKINLPTDKTTSVDLVHHLHDELIYEVPKQKSQQIAKILKYSMENSVKLQVPLPVKVKIGDSWGTLEEVNL